MPVTNPYGTIVLRRNDPGYEDRNQYINGYNHEWAYRSFDTAQLRKLPICTTSPETSYVTRAESGEWIVCSGFTLAGMQFFTVDHIFPFFKEHSESWEFPSTYMRNVAGERKVERIINGTV